jgi:DNA-binding GntR family transcriptional regulator
MSEEALVPAQRASDTAYQELRDRILDLRLAPGTVVFEQALAGELGLGRMPVREALARLAVDRFVTVQPRRGTTITAPSLEDVADMFDAREAIECGVAHIAARRASPEDLATLAELIAAADRARHGADHEAFLRDDHAVHVFLVHLVHNPLLQDAADRLLLHNLRFWRSYWSTRPARMTTMISHADLLSALQAGDADGAEAAMREHISRSRQLLHADL